MSQDTPSIRNINGGAKEVAITVAATITAADHFLKPCQLVVKITSHTPTNKITPELLLLCSKHNQFDSNYSIMND